MACVAVLSLMRTIELEFLQPQPRPILRDYELIPCNKEFAQSLHKKLGFLMDLLDESRMEGIEAIKNLETKLRDISFKIEDEIEVQVVHIYAEIPEGNMDEESTHHCLRLRQILNPVTGKSHPCLKFRQTLRRAKEDIDAIKEELVKVMNGHKNFKDLQGKKTTLDVLVNPDEVIMVGDFSQHASHSKEIMVGKYMDLEIIKEMLIKRPSKQREIVLIKGMGGIGKTMLARQVYENPSVVSHFDMRAWVVPSQHHNKRQMLLGILKSISKQENLEKRSDDEELALQLYQALKHRRYLIVMDDIWSKEAWDAVKSCFPDDGNCSRVLLTTRIAELAINIGSNSDFSHQMDLLNQSESWDLFCVKACRSHQGTEFEKIGRPIVERCKRLPLAIIVVAGLFSKLNTVDEWKSIAESLVSSATTTIDEECSRIFSLSYNHLPCNLKACFLYLGVFPEDNEINANELSRLWSAEGLVKAFENESFDAVANRYIQELMDRNLIILSKLSRCGKKIKRFRMHDLLHTFCVRESQNENLLHVVSENGSNSSQKGFRWLSIQSVDFDTSILLSSSKSCRSFFYFQSENASFNFNAFNVLRVLYLDGLSKYGDIVGLIHLRYVELPPHEEHIGEFSKAWNLQTLIHGDEEGNYLEFPQLLHISCSYFYGNPPKCVQVLSQLRPDYCTKEYFTNVPNLKEVEIVGKEIDCNDCIENLVNLQQLEKLCIAGNDNVAGSLGRLVLPINNHIVLLKNLKSLECDMSFEWEDINVFTKLPSLEKLFLLSCGEGEVWELPENEKFGKLIYLYIHDSYLKYWKAVVIISRNLGTYTFLNVVD